MLVDYLWTAGGEISKPLLEALSDFALPEYREDLVGDLVALAHELEQEGLGRQEITARIMREVISSALHQRPNASIKDARHLARYLWTESRGISTSFVTSLADLVRPEYRGEFATDLIDLMQDLEEDAVERDRIALRVVAEVREGMGTTTEDGAD
ncbi:MAG: hypothetical protein ACYS6Z_10945 [Planctomycetota bacterium]|jgi:hypothetical protein